MLKFLLKRRNIILLSTAVLFVIIFLTAGIFAGCKTTANQSTSSEVTTGNAMSAETTKKFTDEGLVITGSTTLLEVSNAWAEAFMEKNSGNITINGGGSGEGIKSLINKTTDLANSSRSITDEEKKEAESKGIDVKEYKVLWDGIAVIVSRNVKVSELTFEQLSKIYKGEITNWRELGGDDARIVAATRESTSGTGEYFLENIVRLGNKASQDEYSDKCLFLQTNADVVTQVSQNDNIIGYVGLGYLKEAGDKVNAVKVKKDANSTCVLPGVETVKDKSYPISRELYMYADGNNLSDIAKAYIEFILSDEGQKIGVDSGFVSIK